MKLYLSPARHAPGSNMGVDGRDERTRMAILADKIAAALRQMQIAPQIELKINHALSLRQAIKQSNTWGADVHIALHSNALNGQARGIEAWIYPGNIRMEMLARLIMLSVSDLTGTPARKGTGTRWAKWTDVKKDGWQDGPYLAEVNDTKADSVLFEFYFHDNREDLQAFESRIDEAAELIAAGIAEFMSGRYK